VNDREKISTVSEKMQRDTRRMERFECYGELHITPSEGIADVMIAHQSLHKSYVCIDLPERWHTFIEENHRMGPAKVCRRCYGLLFNEAE